MARSLALTHFTGKGGVLTLTRQLAMESAPHNIRANTIAPGPHLRHRSFIEE